MAASKNRRIRTAPSEGPAAPRKKPAPPPRPPALDGHREDFTFEFRARRTRITEAMMVEALRTRHAQLGGPFTIAEYNAWPERPCSGGLIVLRFKLWRNAMKLAGIQGARGRDYKPHELIKNLELAWRSLGRRPGNHTFCLYSKIGLTPYQRVWGSLRRACELLAKHKRGQLTRKALLHPPRPGRKKMSLRARWRILEAAGHRCIGCGKTSRDRGVRLEVDHIIPVSAGGTDDAANLQVLCLPCNRGKGGVKRPGGGGRAKRARMQRNDRDSPGRVAPDPAVS